jgi:hypothetical protein
VHDDDFRHWRILLPKPVLSLGPGQCDAATAPTRCSADYDEAIANLPFYRRGNSRHHKGDNDLAIAN